MNLLARVNKPQSCQTYARTYLASRACSIVCAVCCALSRPVTQVELVVQSFEEEGEDKEDSEVEVVAPASPELVMHASQPMDGQPEVLVPLPG